MSDWIFLEKHRVRTPQDNQLLAMFCSETSDGFNGMFRLPLSWGIVRCVVSDGFGWQHVSVSVEGSHKPPSWDTMCMIKDLFWDAEDWVVQFHPAKSQYVNNHPGCLHLWRPTDQTMPTPESIMVGIKDSTIRASTFV